MGVECATPSPSSIDFPQTLRGPAVHPRCDRRRQPEIVTMHRGFVVTSLVDFAGESCKNPRN